MRRHDGILRTHVGQSFRSAFQSGTETRMRPWYKYSEKTDDYQQRMVITPFSKIWGYGAPVTIALVIINAAIWLVMEITDGIGWLTLEEWWYKYLAMTPQMVMRGHVYQLLTSIFLHDGLNIIHLVINMYILWMFGTRVERSFGSRRFLVFYLVCGLIGSIASFLMRSLSGDIVTPSLGASAAVFGVLVAYGFLFAHERLLLFFYFPATVWKVVVGFIVIETLLILFGLQEGVDHWAHLGGAAAAAVWMLIQGRKDDHGWTKGGGRGIFGRSRPPKGFRIIVTRPVRDSDHPEGIDNEPPPDWFDIDVDE